jgi:hypothetical protein
MVADGSSISASNITSIPLIRTPQGWIAFSAIFMAKLGSCLTLTLQQTMAAAVNGQVVVIDEKHNALLAHISNKLFIALQEESDLIVELVQNCATGNGAEQFLYLQKKLAGHSVAKEIAGIYSIVQASIRGDCISDVKKMISDNLMLQEKFSDKMLAGLIVSKLPEEFENLRDIFVERDRLPSCAEIVAKLEQRAIIHPQVNEDAYKKMAFVISPNVLCFNCNKKGDHYTRDCKEPPAGCEYCGDKAYHKKEHCFVPNDKPLPAAWKQERKEEMEQKRKEYKEKMKVNIKGESHMAMSEPSLSQMRALIENGGNLSI